MKPGSKYYSLYERLSQIEEDTFTLTFNELEASIPGGLPASARSTPSWWSNRSKGGHQSRAWIDAGYHTQAIDLQRQTVTFQRFQAEYKIERVDGAIKWDQSAIRALRIHLNLTQSEFAASIGVRRQTISEWENGMYLPDRSTMKHLGLVAERASFNPQDKYTPPGAAEKE